MKRLLSWLLALVMIISCLPLSAIPAFAEENTDPTIDVEEVPESSYDWEVDADVFIEYIELTRATTQPGVPFEVEVAAGQAVYYKAVPNFAGMVATIKCNDEVVNEITLTKSDDYYCYFEIENDTKEAQTYTVVVNFPLGSTENPEIIEEMSWFNGEINQPAGDVDGYNYQYTAVADGVVTMYFTASMEGVEGEDGEMEYFPADIVVYNQNTYESLSLKNDGVDNYGWELQVPVAEGDVLSINVVCEADLEGNAYPEAHIEWCGNFAYPAGTEQNPINIEWAWEDEDQTKATATVIVPEGGAYYVGINGMDLTANGAAVQMSETGVFTLAAGTYELKLSTPVGHNSNPIVIEEMPYTDNGTTSEDPSYVYYFYDVTEDGTLTLDVTDGANIIADVLTYVEDSEWPISEQFVLAETNDDWTAWIVAENLEIPVVAGQQVKIQVAGLMDLTTWESPAIPYTLTASFEAASKCDHENLNANTFCPECGMYKLMGATINLGNSLQFAFFAKKVSIDPNGYAVVTHTMEDGTVNTFTYSKGDPEWVDGTNVRINYNGLAAKHMADQLTCTFYNASGEPISLTWVDSMRDYAMRQVKNESNHITLRIAVVDMLIYGAASQVALNYNTDDMADRYLGDYRELATKSVVATNSIVKDEAYYGSVISVDNEIQFSIYLKNKILTNIDSLTARITYKNHNGAQMKTELKKGDASWVYVNSNYTRFYITGLTVADWAQDVTLEMVDADGTTVYSTNVDSMESYIARQIEKDGENAPAVFQAIAKFGTSAYNYFHRNDK